MNEMAGLSKTLETVNSELMEMMKSSEEQESELDLLKEEWMEERSELSISNCKLKALLEDETRLKEESCAEVRV